MTDAERRLWLRLRRRVLGTKFRRQHPFGPYILDFVSLEHRLVIEVDGGQHADSQTDAGRDAFIEAAGFRVLRFDNRQVLVETAEVLEAILAAVLTPSPPRPSP